MDAVLTTEVDESALTHYLKNEGNIHMSESVPQLSWPGANRWTGRQCGSCTGGLTSASTVKSAKAGVLWPDNPDRL
jgi:hypothetical protein